MSSPTQPSVPPAAPARAAHNARALVRWEGHMSDGVGATYGAEPLAFLEADAHEILLSGGRGTFRIPRTAITKIGRGSDLPPVTGGLK